VEQTIMPSNFRRLAPAIVISAAALSASPAAAQGFQDIGALEQRVVTVLGAGIGEAGGPARPVDRRLRLTSCPGELIVEPVVMGAVTVRCQQIGWRIRVPVSRGSETGAAQAEPSQPSRAVVRTARAEPIVRRGDPVSLVVMSGGFTVARQAVADQDGAPGDRIRVRTEPRAAPIVGRVLADGRVEMTGFN
jgi:flagella basal body P-ring formation protein FlgA